MHYQDLAVWEALGKPTGSLLAVGWLEENHPYPSGSVDTAFFAALVELLRDPWQPAMFVGRHACELCAFSGGPSVLDYNGVRVELGRANLFVPAQGVAYVSPSLMVHYIDSHAYLPPDEFRAAVLACPPMRSMDYLRAVAALGLNKLGK
jgi:hypothetical protein